MKEYVIVTPGISNMGGAQMYVRNKVLYMRKHGWEVVIITAVAKNVIINELKEVVNIVPELGYNKYCYTQRRQNRAMEALKNIVLRKPFNEIVVESTSIVTSIWAESLASYVRAKHIIFLLQENNIYHNKGVQDYLLYKHSRRELIGIVDSSLEKLFATFNPIPHQQSYFLPAYCNNVVADINSPWINRIDKNHYDYIVGGLSRLDKPFVLRAIKDFCKFASNYPEKEYLLLWIGDAPKGSSIPVHVREIVNRFRNVELLITGYLLPVPSRLLEMCDVFISSAGSSLVCMRSGIPTITYDGNDYKPIGIIGRTTESLLFRKADELPLDLDDLLNQILVAKKYNKLPSDYESELPDFQSHLDFLRTTNPEKVYFDVDKLKKEIVTEKRVAIGLFLFGPNVYTWMHNIKMRK